MKVAGGLAQFLVVLVNLHFLAQIHRQMYQLVDRQEIETVMRRAVLVGSLRERAEQMNASPESPFRVTELIAFGDFLDESTKVQAADVGVGLTAKRRGETMSATAVEHKREERVLADLKAKSSMLHLHLLEDWMRKRSHRRPVNR